MEVKRFGSHGKYSERLLNRGKSGYLFVEGSIAANDVVGTSSKVSNIDETRNVIEGGIEKMVDEQKTKGEKHPKPPRPPTGPLLHAADIELVKEISKLTRMRRARRERLQALKNMKTDRTSSANINFLAITVTAIFGLVIIFQVHRYEANLNHSAQVLLHFMFTVGLPPAMYPIQAGILHAQ
ncbi:hypothetical protein ACLB2K_065032 [Fragaria x ananassa]